MPYNLTFEFKENKVLVRMIDNTIVLQQGSSVIKLEETPSGSEIRKIAKLIKLMENTRDKFDNFPVPD